MTTSAVIVVEMVVEGETMSAVDKAMNMLTVTVDVELEPDNITHARTVSIVSVSSTSQL